MLEMQPMINKFLGDVRSAAVANGVSVGWSDEGNVGDDGDG